MYNVCLVGDGWDKGGIRVRLCARKPGLSPTTGIPYAADRSKLNIHPYFP